MSTPAEARKPPRRKWAMAGLVLIALALAGYTGLWFWAKGEIEARLDQGANALRGAGYTVELQGRRVGGFPLQLSVRFDQASLSGPSGWGVEIPGLTASAYVFAPLSWRIAAPKGLTLERPLDGPLLVTGDEITASIGEVTRAPWRVSVEGRGLKFTPGAIARAFTLDSIEDFEAHLGPAPDTPGEGELVVQLKGAQVSSDSVLWRVTENAPLQAELRARITDPAAFAGDGWSPAVRAWSQAGGKIELIDFVAQAGRSRLTADGGELAAGPDGRLEGVLPFEYAPAPGAKPTLAMAEANDRPTAAAVAAVEARRSGPASLRIAFQGGEIWLGGSELGPAPRLFQ